MASKRNVAWLLIAYMNVWRYHRSFQNWALTSPLSTPICRKLLEGWKNGVSFARNTCVLYSAIVHMCIPPSAHKHVFAVRVENVG